MQTAANLEKQLERAYFPRLNPGSRIWYKNLMGQIMEMIAACPGDDWNEPLDGNRPRTDYNGFSEMSDVCILAQKTGFTYEDAQVVKECLRTLFENDASSARPEGSVKVAQKDPMALPTG